MQRGAAFPPTWIIVVFGNLVEAELLVVIRPDPFGGVDGALLQRRIDIAAGNLLRDSAALLQVLAVPAADAHFYAFHVFDGLDLLAEPAAHLGAGVAAGNAVYY